MNDDVKGVSPIVAVSESVHDDNDDDSPVDVAVMEAVNVVMSDGVRVDADINLMIFMVTMLLYML